MACTKTQDDYSWSPTKLFYRYHATCIGQGKDRYHYQGIGEPLNLVERIFMISPEQDSEISKLAKSIGTSRSAVLRTFLSHLTKPVVHTKPVHLSGREANNAPRRIVAGGEDIEDTPVPVSASPLPENHGCPHNEGSPCIKCQLAAQQNP